MQIDIGDTVQAKSDVWFSGYRDDIEYFDTRNKIGIVLEIFYFTFCVK